MPAANKELQAVVAELHFRLPLGTNAGRRPLGRGGDLRSPLADGVRLTALRESEKLPGELHPARLELPKEQAERSPESNPVALPIQALRSR